MSGFLGAVRGAGFASVGVSLPADERSWPHDYQWIGYNPIPMEPWRDAALWPSTAFIGSDESGCLLGLDARSFPRWGLDLGWDASGGGTMKKIIGTCRDSTGAVLGSCIVQGFQTATDAFVNQMTCDSAGYFEFCTQFTGQHYLVAYKAGAPDVAGTTANTLVGV